MSSMKKLWLSPNQFYKLLFFLCFYQITTTCLHAQLCTQEQSSALLQFKQHLSFNKSVSTYCNFKGIPSYPKLESWKNGSNCCSWDGVECDRETDQVIGLDLSCGWLQGTIHPNSTLFHYFPHLQRLNLAFNNFGKSPISSEFSWFTRLTHLNLSSSGFSGNVPIEVSFLTQLVSLDLSDNYGLRFEKPGFELLVKNSTKIRELNLRGVNISSVVPNSLLNLTSLTLLNLNKCGLCGEFPSFLANLTELDTLNLKYNHLSGPLPSQIIGLQKLTQLLLGFNSFNGTIPSWVFTLPALEQVHLGFNRFVGHINEFDSNSLKFIDLSYNHLHGTIPRSIFQQENLTFLILSSSNLSGTVEPNMLCHAISLDILDLSNNSLSGAIPQCLGNFSRSLIVLDMRKNRFSGTIPDTFARGNSFKTIKLNDNALEGTIPKSIVNCKELVVLDLGNNKISDTFPHWLGKLPQLRVLILRSNRLHGTLMTSKAKFSFAKLQIIDISDNKFTGPLPTTYLKNFRAMMNINEQANSKLQYMSYSSVTADHVYYFYESFTITMKWSIFNLRRVLTVLTVIDLSQNNFEGTIPKSIGKLSSIQGLNLSSNNLTGHIPSSLGNLRMLEFLDLSSNKLEGKIPQQLTNLTFLEVLNLSQNQLTGPIPRGKQFDTFSNDSYSGNMGLCGPPLSNACSNFGGTQLPPLTSQQEDNLQSPSGFDWGVIMSGYGCGMVFGLVVGYLMLSMGRPQWLVRIIEDEWQGIGRKTNKHASRFRGPRN